MGTFMGSGTTILRGYANDMGLEFLGRIRAQMNVYSEDDRLCGVVDRLEVRTNSVKLNRDASGHHHWLPLSWVSDVDYDSVYLTLTLDQIKKSWKETPPPMVL